MPFPGQTQRSTASGSTFSQWRGPHSVPEPGSRSTLTSGTFTIPTLVSAIIWVLQKPVLRIRCLFDPCIRDPGLVKKIKMDIPDHISESFWVKNTWILWCESGSGIRNLFGLDPGVNIRINIPDPQHWQKHGNIREFTVFLLLWSLNP